MGRISYHRRLATRFTHARLSVDAGTIFVPPHPIDLERHFGSQDEADSADDTLTAFERLVDAERYQLVLSLGWGGRAASSHTLDLGLLRVDGDKLFVVHQLNDDAGTSLILAYLSSDAPSRLFRLFLVDYLSSQGTGYMVTLPRVLPESIWVVQPEIVPQAALAAGLLGLVSPVGDWGSMRLSAAEQPAPPTARRGPLVA